MRATRRPSRRAARRGRTSRPRAARSRRGFLVGDDPTASAARYIEAQSGSTSDDAPGSSRATYDLMVETAGTYFIWGRIRSPSTSTNRLWVQVDGGAWLKSRITVGDIWFWNSFHDDTNYGVPLTFPLSAGAHQLVFANCVDGVELNRLYYTTGQETPPGNTTPCRPPTRSSSAERASRAAAVKAATRAE